VVVVAEGEHACSFAGATPELLLVNTTLAFMARRRSPSISHAAIVWVPTLLCDRPQPSPWDRGRSRTTPPGRRGWCEVGSSSPHHGLIWKLGGVSITSAPGSDCSLGFNSPSVRADGSLPPTTFLACWVDGCLRIV